eukprot:TRINITY_DN1282_c0_g2_i1.p1 TRINITY_DN1282_c0_g2~~TRINITY_DN1282_c0_g2_i1.p1  ORF type:complete len:848 (-),score=115.97 TRINITY_DN1282_c0_g2_i1:42-2261(-)
MVAGSGAVEIAAGIGWYLRERCNVTIGWPRGGGSWLPAGLVESLPRVGARVIRHRTTTWSYMMNVCTHSYSFVWYTWHDWERFIDWMALQGINMVLATTGQEEVQYKVFRKLGLSDDEIRGWFNGPALLAWSRGQNEYGAGVAGPLPRSFMRQQWSLQKLILKRYRELGIIGQLPAFQGNVPAALKSILHDSNMTTKDGTGWIDALDPTFGRIADAWMRTLIDDFGTDHWYQLDGYFNGGTAPWLALSSLDPRPGDKDAWLRRGRAAYEGLARTDPKAVWSFQGFALAFWGETEEESYNFRSFVDAVPPGHFLVIDMDWQSEGEWRKWNDSSFFRAPFIQTSIHNFGGTDGLRGDLNLLKLIPFDASRANTSIVGSGFTAEGIDQNPVYYELLLESNWFSEPADVTAWLERRAERRYGSASASHVWELLQQSVYGSAGSVSDNTGVSHIPNITGGETTVASTGFKDDRQTPTEWLCTTFSAWRELLRVVRSLDANLREPLRYDLVNLGREVLAQIATPAAFNFSAAIRRPVIDRMEVQYTRDVYTEILEDLDKLVATDSAFLLGPWLQAARSVVSNGLSHSHETLIQEDCENDVGLRTCSDFFEWNARSQITTWLPAKLDMTAWPFDTPLDYAAKHWSGLIKDYYAARVHVVAAQALKDASVGKVLNRTAVDRRIIEFAHGFQTAVKTKYPIQPVGNLVDVSMAMLQKYAPSFAPCQSVGSDRRGSFASAPAGISTIYT